MKQTNRPMVSYYLDMLEKRHGANMRRFLWPASVSLLFITTVCWSLMGQIVHMTNADQLADPKLFASFSDFHGAVFPGAHTFFIKWPLFWLISLAKYNHFTVYAIGVAVALMVVGMMLLIVMRLESRSIVRSALVLALASILVVIPAEPYAGGLLPENMAMLATRNIEYVMFICAIWLIFKKKLVRWHVVAALFVLTTLFMSDKLFAVLALGAGGCALIYHVILFKSSTYSTKKLRRLGLWFMACLISLLFATVSLKSINTSGATNIISDNQINPYGVSMTLFNVSEGIIFSIVGVATNFGAQPLDNLEAAKLGTAATIHELFHPGLVSHLVNGLLLVYACYAVWKMATNRKLSTGATWDIQLILVGASLTAAAVFVLTNHNYPVDARYMTISFFALFFAIILFVSKQRFSNRLMMIIIPILLLSVALGLGDMLRTTAMSLTADQKMVSQNHQVVSELERLKISRLVGDYWRVYPIADEDHGLTVTPLASCRVIRRPLASDSWQATSKKPFAYLLSEKKGQTDFPACSLADAISIYGKPSEVYRISNTEKLVVYR